MTKFHGYIGYVNTVTDVTGVTREVVTETECSGMLIRNYLQAGPSNKVVEDFNISNTISVRINPTLLERMMHLKYIAFLSPMIDGRWKIKTVDMNYPNLVLTLGGVYNG